MLSLRERTKYDRINQSKVRLNKNCISGIKNWETWKLTVLRKTCILKKFIIRKREISISVKRKTAIIKWTLTTSYSKPKWKRVKLRWDKNVGIPKSTAQ